MNYRGFEIIKDKYIEERHPQYNYLSFIAMCNKKYLYIVFRDTDMRIAIEKQLLRIFISRLNRFIEYNTDTSAGHPAKDDDIVRYSLETRRVQDKELEQ